MKPALLALALATPAILATPTSAQTPHRPAPRSIRVTMTDHGFVPRNIVVRRGAPYVLTVTNRSDKGHNLTQEAFFRAARIASRDRGVVGDGQIVLAPGQRVTVRFEAPLSRRGGHYQFTSTVLGDADDEYKGNFLIR